MIKTITKTALIAALAGIATTASANVTYNDDGAPVLLIDARGYDLNTSIGVAALTRHVRAAAREVCFTGSSSLGVAMKEKRCFERSFAEAQTQIERLRISVTQRGDEPRSIQVADSKTTR
jgi:UrcA family protein